MKPITVFDVGVSQYGEDAPGGVVVHDADPVVSTQCSGKLQEHVL